jgi:hypothetical protein
MGPIQPSDKWYQRIIPWWQKRPQCRANYITPLRVKNVWTYCYLLLLFPCGFGRVATHLLSKIEGFDHRVIYVGGPWKAHDQLRLADTLTYTQFRVLSLILFVKLQCLLQIWSTIFYNTYPNSQMENIKVDVSDRGTWSKHLTLHWTICIMPIIIEILPKIY